MFWTSWQMLKILQMKKKGSVLIIYLDWNAIVHWRRILHIRHKYQEIVEMKIHNFEVFLFFLFCCCCCLYLCTGCLCSIQEFMNHWNKVFLSTTALSIKQIFVWIQSTRKSGHQGTNFKHLTTNKILSTEPVSDFVTLY